MKITHQTGVRGTGNPTVGDLRLLVAELAEPRIPDSARVELYMADPDRPGELSSWSVQVRWEDETTEVPEVSSVE